MLTTTIPARRGDALVFGQVVPAFTALTQRRVIDHGTVKTTACPARSVRA